MKKKVEYDILAMVQAVLNRRIVVWLLGKYMKLFESGGRKIIGMLLALRKGGARRGHTPVTMRASLNLSAYAKFLVIVHAWVPAMGCVVTDTIDFAPGISQAPLIKDASDTTLPIGGIQVFSIDQTPSIELRATITEPKVDAPINYRMSVDCKFIGQDILPPSPDRSLNRSFRKKIFLVDIYTAGSDISGGRCRLVQLFFSREPLGDSTLMTPEKVSTASWWLGLVENNNQSVDLRLCQPCQQVPSASAQPNAPGLGGAS